MREEFNTDLNLAHLDKDTLKAIEDASVTMTIKAEYPPAASKESLLTEHTKNVMALEDRNTVAWLTAHSQFKDVLPGMDPKTASWIVYSGTYHPSAIVKLDAHGTLTFFDQNGREIYDDYLTTYIEDTPEFARLKKQLDSEHAKKLAQLLEGTQDHALDILPAKSPKVLPAAAYEQELEGLKPQTCEPKPFSEPQPTRDEVRAELESEAERELHASTTFRLAEKREKYVEERLEERLNLRLGEWWIRKGDFEKEARLAAAEQNVRFHDEYLAKKAEMEQALEGGKENIETAARTCFDSLDMPVDLGADFEFSNEDDVLVVDLDLPGLEEMQKVELSIYGEKLWLSHKSWGDLNSDFVRHTFGLAVYLASSLFAECPRLDRITMSASMPRRDQIGELFDDYVLSIKFLREGFIGIDRYDDIDPEEFCTQHFSCRCDINEEKELQHSVSKETSTWVIGLRGFNGIEPFVRKKGSAEGAKSEFSEDSGPNCTARFGETMHIGASQPDVAGADFVSTIVARNFPSKKWLDEHGAVSAFVPVNDFTGYVSRFDSLRPGFTIKLSPDGRRSYLDAGGRTIEDDQEEKSAIELDLKRHNVRLPRNANEEHKKAVTRLAEELNGHNAEVISPHTKSSEVLPLEHYERKLAELEPQKSEVEAFEEAQPTRDEVRAQLEEEAERDVRSLALWKLDDLRAQYVDEHLEARYAQATGEWLARKQRFQEEARLTAAENNVLLYDNYVAKKSALETTLEDGSEAVETAVRKRLEQLDLMPGVDASFKFFPEAHELMLELILPFETVLPGQNFFRYVIDDDLVYENKQEAERGDDFTQYAFSLAIHLASCLFAERPRIATITVSGYEWLKMGCLYSIRFKREGFFGVDYASIDPLEFCMRFENRCRLQVGRGSKLLRVKPYDAPSEEAGRQPAPAT